MSRRDCLNRKQRRERRKGASCLLGFLRWLLSLQKIIYLRRTQFGMDIEPQDLRERFAESEDEVGREGAP